MEEKFNLEMFNVGNLITQRNFMTKENFFLTEEMCLTEISKVDFLMKEEGLPPLPGFVQNNLNDMMIDDCNR